MAAYYLFLKHLHITCVVSTLLSFSVRGLWMLLDSPMSTRRWVEIAPHIIDTLLLASGLALAFTLGQYPFVHAWLTAKFFALIGYIVLGTIALKRGRTKTIRVWALAGALLAFAYLVGTALNRSPAVLNWERFFFAT